MLAIKFDIEKFYGRTNFGLWQVQVKNLLIQSRSHKALKGKSTTIFEENSKTSKPNMSDQDWEKLDLKATSAIRLCLAKNILTNVHEIFTTKELWEFKELYQAKSISNQVYLNE